MSYIKIETLLKDKELIEFNGYATYCGNPVTVSLISEVLKSGLNVLDFATQLNGVYNLVYKLSGSNKLYAFTDRLGIRPYYILSLPGKIGLSEKLNRFTNVKSLSVNKSAILEFISTGHYIENKTMFNEVTRLKPATIYEFDVKENKITDLFRYWSWSDINKVEISFESAVDKVYELYKKSVERCIKQLSKDDKLSIMLSGGLDSRLLYAESRKQYSSDIPTYTFGKKGCADFDCVTKLSTLFGVSTNFFYINDSNWQKGRESKIVESDGMFNYYHMHAASTVDIMAKTCTHVMNGYIGDVVMGGSYLNNKLNKRPSISFIRDKFGNNNYDLWNDDYFDFDCADPYQIYIRGTRFVAAGSEIIEEHVVNLKPFVDYELLDFLYSLPDEFRYRSNLYSVLLRKFYPDYFETVEWVNTGKLVSNRKISFPRLKCMLIRLSSPIKKYIKNTFNVSKGESYQGYSQWMIDSKFDQQVELMVEEGIKFNDRMVLTPSELKKALNEKSGSKYLEALSCIYTTVRFFEKCEENDG